MTDVRTEAAPAAATQGRSKHHGGFIWYEVMTPDPVGAKAFYEAVIPGWSIGERNPGDIDYRMIGRSDGGNAGGVLRMSEDMRDHGAKPLWLGYVSVADVDGIVAQVEARGGKAHMPVTDIPDVGRIALLADPQGASFYVMTPKPPAGADNETSDVFSLDAEQRVGWNELSTSDAAAALAFYTELFGWEKGDTMPMGAAGDYQFIDRNGQMIGAVFPASAGAFPDEQPHWRYYIRVPSIGQAIEAAKATGGTAKVGPMEVPGGDHIIIGQDPQGAEFALVGKQ